MYAKNTSANIIKVINSYLVFMSIFCDNVSAIRCIHNITTKLLGKMQFLARNSFEDKNDVHSLDYDLKDFTAEVKLIVHPGFSLF